MTHLFRYDCDRSSSTKHQRCEGVAKGVELQFTNAGEFQAWFEMILCNIVHVQPPTHLVREHPHRLRLTLCLRNQFPPVLALLFDMCDQGNNNIILEVNAADILRLCWSDLSMLEVDAPLNQGVRMLTIQVQVGNL